MKVIHVGEEGVIAEESPEEIQEAMKDPSQIHYAGMIDPPRPGVLDCIVLLEHRDYVPDTPRNELFIMRILNWQGMKWVLVSIPLTEKHLMEKAADECGLRVANGIPTMISGTGTHFFPANSGNVFTLENKPGHPVYRNTR